MKRGKIVLSLVALVCTVAGALAMKSAKYTGRNQCYTTVVLGAGKLQAVNCWTLGTAAHHNACPNGVGAIFYTSQGAIASFCTTTN